MEIESAEVIGHEQTRHMMINMFTNMIADAHLSCSNNIMATLFDMMVDTGPICWNNMRTNRLAMFKHYDNILTCNVQTI